MSRLDRLAALFSLLGALAAAWVGWNVFERLPHIEDEVAYVWQANLLADGRLTIPSPPAETYFLTPFVVDYNGQRFGKYPLGWPMVLAAGVRLGLRDLVNPLLGGLGIWFTYLLGKRLFRPGVALLAAGLLVVSPFFLLNSSSLLSHPLGMLLSVLLSLAWLDAFEWPSDLRRAWLAALTAGLCLALLVLTRPLTAAALALPLALHGLYLLAQRSSQTRMQLVTIGLLAALAGLLHLAWQAALTGDAFLNPYTLWWSYDTVGFGPGNGVLPEGHSLLQGWKNARDSLSAGIWDVFGWGALTYPLVLVGLWRARRSWPAWLLAWMPSTVFLAYLAYWIGSSLFGPRYYYEGLPPAALFAAAGIFTLAGRRIHGPAVITSPGDLTRLAWRKRLVTAWIALLVGFNLLFYLPMRLESMRDLYTISRSDQQPFLSAEVQAMTPALVLVYSEQWMSYGALLELQDPALSSPLIFAWISEAHPDGARAQAEALHTFYPQRTLLYYYPERSDSVYTEPLNLAEEDAPAR